MLALSRLPELLLIMLAPLVLPQGPVLVFALVLVLK